VLLQIDNLRPRAKGTLEERGICLVSSLLLHRPESVLSHVLLVPGALEVFILLPEILDGIPVAFDLVHGREVVLAHGHFQWLLLVDDADHRRYIPDLEGQVLVLLLLIEDSFGLVYHELPEEDGRPLGSASSFFVFGLGNGLAFRLGFLVERVLDHLVHFVELGKVDVPKHQALSVFLSRP